MGEEQFKKMTFQTQTDEEVIGEQNFTLFTQPRRETPSGAMLD